MDLESVSQFEHRKEDHIQLALLEDNEASGKTGLDKISLVHEALPDLNFDEIDIQIKSLGHNLPLPFFVSSMTAGHKGSLSINKRLAQVSEQCQWWMGVGSQRKELIDFSAATEWIELRKVAPSINLMGNIGLSQLIKTSTDKVKELCDQMQARAMIIHLNALQECLQPEGTPQFKGGLQAIENLCNKLKLPVVVKETGCGISALTFKSLESAGVSAIDVSGFGGTHWGRIETMRSKAVAARSSEKNAAIRDAEIKSSSGRSFAQWGISTVDSVLQAKESKIQCEIWASGGVRNGLDAYKLLAMGVSRVGFAKPLLQAALKSEEALCLKMKTFKHELQTAMFCTGVGSLDELKNKKVWKCQNS